MKVRELVEEKLPDGRTKLKEGKNIEWIMFLIEFYPGYDLDMDVLDFIGILVKEVGYVRRKKMKKYILAVLEMVDCDDSMIVVKTGCRNGNDKEVTAVLNEKNCVALGKELVIGLVKNWHLYCKSPEYVLPTLLRKIYKKIIFYL
jgi:hypothetical protein